jgi:hypothetical protein
VAQQWFVRDPIGSLADISDCKQILCRMLVTDPLQRATLTEVLAHPWMNKGYDTAPDAHLVVREPLRADELDMEIIKGMTGFEFGEPREIEAKLHDVLTSSSYLQVLHDWENRKDSLRKSSQWRNGPLTDSSNTAHGMASSSSMSLEKGTEQSPSKLKSGKRFSGFDFYRKKLFSSSGKDDKPSGAKSVGNGVDAAAREPEPLDPTRGFHPLISIYYLVREKIERERVYGPGHFASSQLSLDTSGMPEGKSLASSGFGMALPHLPPPASTVVADSSYDHPSSPRFPPGHTSVPPSPNPDIARVRIPSGPQPRGRAALDSFGGAESPNAVMQHPGADQEHSNIADMPAVLAKTGDSTNGPRRSVSQRVSEPPAAIARVRDSISQSPTVPPTIVQDHVNDEEAIDLDRPLPGTPQSSQGFAKRFGSMLGRSSEDSVKRAARKPPVSPPRSSSMTGQALAAGPDDGLSAFPSSAPTPSVLPLPSSQPVSPEPGALHKRSATILEPAPATRQQRRVSIGSFTGSIGKASEGTIATRRAARPTTIVGDSTSPPAEGWRTAPEEIGEENEGFSDGPVDPAMVSPTEIKSVYLKGLFRCVKLVITLLF